MEVCPKTHSTAPESKPHLSRRELLGLGVIGFGAVAFGGCSMNRTPRETPRTERSAVPSLEQKETETLPETIDFLIMGNIPPEERERIESTMHILQLRLEETCNWHGAWSLRTVPSEENATYTPKKVEDMIEANRQDLSPDTLESTITGALLVGGNVKIGNCGGYAVPDKNLFVANARTTNGEKLSNDALAYVVAHELGHAAFGLPHPRELSTCTSDRNDTLSQYGALGSIQELLRTERIQQPLHHGGTAGDNRNGKPDEYTVPVTVMGNRLNVVDHRAPVFSPAEIVYLDDSREVNVYDKKSLPGPDQKIALSYREGDTFAALLELPPDHALHQVLPNVKHICFGPTIESFNARHLPFDDERTTPQIRVFAIDENGRDTTQLNIGIFTKIDNDGDGKEVVLYADEQLDIVAVAGRMDDSNDPYVRFLPLSGKEGSRIFEAEKTRTEERNKILLNPA
ncbi:hypothetical protein CR983_03320 [Candidatus Saccharibacteria bacterium]|nr:MAG: hypothetical protein CR983_03320 [Candidatus Saccharibacteria bacterium]